MNRVLTIISEINRTRYVAPDLSRRIQKWYDTFHVETGDISTWAPFALSVSSGDKVADRSFISVFLGTDQYPKRLNQFIREFRKNVLKGSDYKYLGHRQGNHPRYNKRLGFTVSLFNYKVRTEKYVKPRYLYHITNIENKDNILRRGLIPQKGPRDSDLPEYGSRTYLLTEEEDWIYAVDSGIPGWKTNKTGFVVIRVDTKKFDRFNIFEDMYTLTNNAVWTPTHIPPRALDIVFEHYWKGN